MKYVLGIDQSTQGTKALLFDESGKLLCRSDLPHKQLINDKGWVEHDLNEIYANTIQVVKDLVVKAGINKADIVTLGISNQRETSACWSKETGEPVYNAIVWQCGRATDICKRLEDAGRGPEIKKRTGIPLSPYFSAAKLAWILENVDGLKEKAEKGLIACGTIDSFLVYKLTGGKEFRTDYSNASRTQLFNVSNLEWDKEILSWYGIPENCMATLTDSNGLYGYTDFEGYLDKAIPIHAVMGDSHGALFGQGCLSNGMIKATYGTGSSIMMNVGEKPVFTDLGVVTSLAWSLDGKVNYVLEGNINYSGAVITWLKDDVKLIESPKETADLAKAANPNDRTVLVPAFTGLGAPYWDSDARAVLCNMSRTTGKAEIVKAGLDSIVHQITDIVNLMKEASGIDVKELRVDGGPTRNDYLMQYQSDMLGIAVSIPESEELSGIGVAYAAGLAERIYSKEVFSIMGRVCYTSNMDEIMRKSNQKKWDEAIAMVRTK